MNLRKNIGLDILSYFHSFVLFWGIYPLIGKAYIYDSFHPMTFCSVGLLLFLPIISSQYLIRHTKHLWSYLLFGIGISYFTGILAEGISNYLSLPKLTHRILASLLSLLLFLIHGYIRIKKSQLQKSFQELPNSSTEKIDYTKLELPMFLDAPHPLHWIWFVLLYFVGVFLKDDFLWHFAFYLLLTDIILCFIHQYISRFFSYLSGHLKDVTVPLQTMKKTVNIILLCILPLLFLFVLPALLYGKEPLTEIKPKPITIEYHQEFGTQTNEPVQQANPDMMFGEVEPLFEIPEWLEKLMNILPYVICIVIVIVLLIAIYNACRRAGKFFASETEDEIEFLDKGFSDTGSFLSVSKEKGRFSPNMKVRKLYKKVLRKAYRKNTPSPSYTPFELEKNAGFDATDNFHKELHYYYEKARYSKDGCSEEDAQKIIKGYKA